MLSPRHQLQLKVSLCLSGILGDIKLQKLILQPLTPED
jgi:hypothetical protein